MTAVKSGLMVIDQHRAHVRILYEEYTRKDGNPQGMQKMLFPEVVQFPPSDIVVLQSLTPHLERLGFELTDLGGGSYALAAIPAGLDGLDPVKLVQDLVTSAKDTVVQSADNQDTSLTSHLSPLTSRLSLTLARSAAIPYGQVLSNDEMENLVNRLFACANVNWQTFWGLEFTNCVFSGDFRRASSDCRRLFLHCVFRNCRGDINLTYGTDYDDSSGYYGNGTECFYGCVAFDSVFRVTSSGNPHRFDGCSYFENCFLQLGGVTRLSDSVGAPHYNVLGNRQRFVDTTLVVGSATEWTAGGFVNCLLGLGSADTLPAPANVNSCILTNANAVLANLGGDLRPTEPSWRAYGYNRDQTDTDIGEDCGRTEAGRGCGRGRRAERVDVVRARFADAPRRGHLRRRLAHRIVRDLAIWGRHGAHGAGREGRGNRG